MVTFATSVRVESRSDEVRGGLFAMADVVQALRERYALDQAVLGRSAMMEQQQRGCDANDQVCTATRDRVCA